MAAATATLRRPAPPAVRETAGGRPLLSLAVARGSMFVALALVGSLHWMAMLEPAATRRAWYAVGAGALTMLGLLAAGRLPRRRDRTPAAAATALIGAALALLAGGLADEHAAPGQLGRADVRRGPRHRRAAGRARALPRRRRLDAPGDRPGRDRARRARGARGLLAARPRAARVPRRRARPARDALRGPRRGARLQRRVPPRRAADAARHRLPAARAAASPRGAGRGRAGARRRRRRAHPRARARRRRAVVGLRDVGALDRRLEVHRVLVGPRLRAARLAPRRPRDDPRQGAPAGVLEGREPR